MSIIVKDLLVKFSMDSGTITAVNGISFEIPEGKTLCLVGESGSGKSVTALSLLRLVENPGKIVSGQIFLGDQNILELGINDMYKIRGAEISMIFQEPMTSLNPSFTVGYQIKETLKLHQKLNRAELKEKALEALRLVAIGSPEKIMKEYPFNLSGGMRQRVMIALAMACRPKLLIADEPTTALDVTIQAQMLDLMNGLKQERNTSLLFITHDLAVVSEMADMVAVMYTGNIIEYCNSSDLFKNPLHPYTEGLLKSLPSENRGRRKSRLYSIEGNVPSLTDLPSGCSFQLRCPYAAKICEEKTPILKEIQKGHNAACHKAQGLI